jgi:DNA-binding beta-propeller fold protein YncE
LTQKAGTAGCISQTGTSGVCVDGTALDAPNGVVVSPDGTSVYVASLNSSAVAVFDREEPPPADMSMSLQGRPSPLTVGSQLTYKLRIRNDGPGTAIAVTGVLTLAPTETFVSATSACVHAAGVITCTIPRAIVAGAGATPSVTVTETQVGLIQATATVSAANADPNPGNNAATERTRVLP